MELPASYSLPRRRQGFVAKRSVYGSAYALFYNGYFFGEISLCDVGDMGVWVFVSSDPEIAERADGYGLSGDMSPRDMLPLIRKAYEDAEASHKAEAEAEAWAESAYERAMDAWAFNQSEIDRMYGM